MKTDKDILTSQCMMFMPSIMKNLSQLLAGQTHRHNKVVRIQGNYATAKNVVLKYTLPWMIKLLA
jgi:hypothetical protein